MLLDAIEWMSVEHFFQGIAWIILLGCGVAVVRFAWALFG